MSKGAEFERQVIQLAHLYSWRVASFRSVPIRRNNGSIYYATPVQADGKGFPDCVLVRRGTLMVRELKSGKARLTGEQREWIEALKACGVDAGVWHDDDIEAIILELKNR